jgi:hypothetical protein
MVKVARFTYEHNARALNLDRNGDVLPAGVYAFDVKGDIPAAGPLGPFTSKAMARKAAGALWYPQNSFERRK